MHVSTRLVALVAEPDRIEDAICPPVVMVFPPMTLPGLLTGGTVAGPLLDVVVTSALMSLLPQLGQVIWLHGTPAGWITVVPQTGQTHVSTRLVALAVEPERIEDTVCPPIIVFPPLPMPPCDAPP